MAAVYAISLDGLIDHFRVNGRALATPRHAIELSSHQPDLGWALGKVLQNAVLRHMSLRTFSLKPRGHRDQAIHVLLQLGVI